VNSIEPSQRQEHERIAPCRRRLIVIIRIFPQQERAAASVKTQGASAISHPIPSNQPCDLHFRRSCQTKPLILSSVGIFLITLNMLSSPSRNLVPPSLVSKNTGNHTPISRPTSFLCTALANHMRKSSRAPKRNGQTSEERKKSSGICASSLI